MARRAVTTMVKIFILFRVGKEMGIFFCFFGLLCMGCMGKGRVVLPVCSNCCLKLDTADERRVL